MTGDATEAAGQNAQGGRTDPAPAKADGADRSVAANKGHFLESDCLNCGTALVGSHCHSCGQKAHLHRTLNAFWHDLLHGALHFDGKMWRTLPMLVVKPGELTRRYIDGERARFVSPMALFLFTVFLMFAVFQAVGLTTPSMIGADGGPFDPRTQMKAQAIAARADLQAQQDALPEDATAERAEIQNGLEKITEAMEAIDDGNPFRFQTGDGETVEMTSSGTGVEFIDAIGSKWRQNPGLMLYKMQANFYKFSWLLIPLSIPFVWVLFFWKKRFSAYDHAIFITYSLAFMSLLFVALSLLGVAGASANLLVVAALLIVPIHLYKQLRHTYDLQRSSAAWRLIVLLHFITIIVGLFVPVLLALGAF